jgi:hypothetical protein
MIMGVPCVKSFGEAEALCAQLDEAGVRENFLCVYCYICIFFFSFHLLQLSFHY